MKVATTGLASSFSRLNSTPKVRPMYEDEYRVEYAPDVLPRAKPGHKVFFHKQLEILICPESHPG